MYFLEIVDGGPFGEIIVEVEVFDWVGRFSLSCFFGVGTWRFEFLCLHLNKYEFTIKIKNCERHPLKTGIFNNNQIMNRSMKTRRSGLPKSTVDLSHQQTTNSQELSTQK